MRANHKAVAWLFILLLAGQSVNQVYAVKATVDATGRVKMLSEDGHLQKHFQKHFHKQFHDASSHSGHGEVLHNASRVAERAFVYTNYFNDYFNKGSTGENPTCQSWAKDGALYTQKAQALRNDIGKADELLAQASKHRDVEKVNGVSRDLLNGVKALGACLYKYTQNGIDDENYRRILAKGLDESFEPSSGGAQSDIEWLVGSAGAKGRRLLTETPKLEELAKEAECETKGTMGNFETILIKDPTCESQACKDAGGRDQNVFPATCGDDLVPAFGSGEWLLCGTMGRGSTKSCNMNKGGQSGMEQRPDNNMCCCRAGKLNGNPADVDKNAGCTTKCDASQTQEAQRQRALWHNVQLVAEERFGPTCKYETRMKLTKPFKDARAAMEKVLYKLAESPSPNVDLGALDETQQDLVSNVGSMMAQMEEDQQMSFLDVEDGDGCLGAWANFFTVVCWILFLIMCSLFPLGTLICVLWLLTAK